MRTTAQAPQWFSHFLLKALMSRVNRLAGFDFDAQHILHLPL
jgi:hypothetical protein